MKRVYFDYAATTPVDTRVLSAMLPYFSDDFGNPSSVHTFGQKADAALSESRLSVARLLNARPQEITFTSCGTESDNLALRGISSEQAKRRGARHILLSPVEHHAVSSTAQQLAAEEGFEIEFLPVDEYGQVSPDDVAAMIRPSTALVSVMYANNEIGTINPIRKIGAVCREKGVFFHTDAVQAAAYLPLNVEEDRLDAVSLGAHKFYGPKGVGALFIRRGVPVRPFQTGGRQENGMRAGTENVPLIVGLAQALALANEERAQRTAHVLPLRDQIIRSVLQNIPHARLTGHPEERLPNHASFAFEGVESNALLMMLDLAGFACSAGSACKTGNPEPSDVLCALGLPRSWAMGSLRITLGKESTAEQVDQLLTILPGLVQKARNANRSNGS